MGTMADIIIRSDMIFTGQANATIIDGFVAISGNKILAVEQGTDVSRYKMPETRVINKYGCVVSPGFVDNHVFFMGYMWEHLGLYAAPYQKKNDLIDALKLYEESLKEGETLYAYDLWENHPIDKKLLNEVFPHRPVILFTEERQGCRMNDFAREKYQFEEDEVWAEKCYQIFQELVSDHSYAKDQYLMFQEMLAKQGITSIKEIGFDDYYGFTQVLKELEDEQQLIHRVNLVSQPVSAGVDISYGIAMREQFTGPFIRFMGYNIMVDGDIEDYEGDIFDPYPDADRAKDLVHPDYHELEKEVLRADSEGFRCALHAEGDRAVHEVINIYERVQRISHKKDARHAIVDMELVEKADLCRMRELGITAINYVQIMNCYPKYEDYYGAMYFSPERQKTIWPYRTMKKESVNLCWGTDLPLDVPDIPQSIGYACYRQFSDNLPIGGYNPEEAITPQEVLEGWTYSGQKANFEEKRLGLLKEGYLADLAIFDGDVLHAKEKALKKIKVCMTISDGRIVYEE